MFIIVTDAGCQLPPIKPGANTLFQPGGERNFLSKQKYGSRITEWNLVSEASGCKGCRAPRAKKMWVVLVWKLVILAWILCYVEIFLFFNNIQGVPRGSMEFPNQIPRQIGQEVHELWSDMKTDKQITTLYTYNKCWHFFMFYILNEFRH